MHRDRGIGEWQLYILGRFRLMGFSNLGEFRFMGLRLYLIYLINNNKSHCIFLDYLLISFI